MAVIQEAFDIPADIITGLLTGEMRRIGGVVRYAVGPNKGQIVKHLKPVNIQEAENAKGAIKQGVELIKGNKKGAAIIAGGAIAAGSIIYLIKKVVTAEPKVLRDFRNALREYLDAIREGALSIDIINKMDNTLGALKQHKNYKKFAIELSAEEIEVLVNRIQEYTIKLADDNNVEVNDINKTDDAFNNFENCLKIQKHILELAA